MKDIESTYGIFKNKKSGKKLVYYPCPKNANSSAKLFFAKHLGIENKFFFIEDDIQGFNKKKYSEYENKHKDKQNLINFLTETNYSIIFLILVEPADKSDSISLFINFLYSSLFSE